MGLYGNLYEILNTNFFHPNQDAIELERKKEMEYRHSEEYREEQRKVTQKLERERRAKQAPKPKLGVKPAALPAHVKAGVCNDVAVHLDITRKRGKYFACANFPGLYWYALGVVSLFHTHKIKHNLFFSPKGNN